MKYESFLKENFFLFKGISQEKVNKMLSFGNINVLEYLPHETMFSSSQESKIAIIVKGNAIILTDNDDGVIIKKLSIKDVYGTASLFDKPTYSTCVKAVTTCTVIVFNKEFIDKCIGYDIDVAKNYITFLAKRISFLNSKIASFSAKNVNDKLYAYLLQLPRENNIIELKVSISTLSKMIGIGRASLYRAFDSLVESGKITKDKKTIILNEV